MHEASSTLRRAVNARSGPFRFRTGASALLLLAASLASGCASLEHAPGPEDPALVAATRGTLILTKAGGFVRSSLELVDLPTLRALELRVPGGWAVLGGLDDAGRIAYLVPVANFEGWELRILDAASGRTEKVLDLERAPWRLRQAPSGASLALWQEGALELEIVGFESRSRLRVDPAVGEVEEAHWLPDGRTLAVDGALGGALVDAATGEVRERSAGYGPFSPDGDTFLARRDSTLHLIERASGRTLAAPARFPWPLQYQGAASELPSPDTAGLCGRQLGLYPALPTEGMPTRRVGGNGVLVQEVPVLKVSDLVSGRYATLRFHAPWSKNLLYSPARLASFAPEARRGPWSSGDPLGR